MEPRGYSGNGVKWVCSKDPWADILFDSHEVMFQAICRHPDGPPKQEIDPPENEHLRPIFDSCIESYQKLWPKLTTSMTTENDYSGASELCQTASKIEAILLAYFDLHWADIIHLRTTAPENEVTK